MQKVAQNHSRLRSLEAVQTQTNEINKRFSALESFLEQSFQSILQVLSQQKSQMDTMSVDLGRFKQDSLAMSQQIKSLLFSKKNKTDMHHLAPQSQQISQIQAPGLFSNGFQLGDSLNQIKLLQFQSQNRSQQRAPSFLEESHHRSPSQSSLLKREFDQGLNIDLKSLGPCNQKDLHFKSRSIRETPRAKGEGALKFETPKGKREALERFRSRRKMPPKIKNRFSVISKRHESQKRNKKHRMLRRKKKNIKRKANLNLFSEKLGELNFGSDDLKSGLSDSFQDQSHFLDKVSQNQSISQDLLEAKERSNPSLGVFCQPQPLNLNGMIFNVPKINQQVSGSGRKNRVTSIESSFLDSVNIPSLHLESKSSSKNYGKSIQSKMESGRTINNDSKKNIRNFNEELSTPSLGRNANISIFSVNRKQANLKSIHQKVVPILPVLQSETKNEDQILQEKKSAPNFYQQMQQPPNLILNKIVNFEAKNVKEFNIRDPLLGENTPSTINHSKLKKNLNAIQFDFSYNTAQNTKEFIPEFANFESKNSSRFGTSNFEITPLQYNQGKEIGKLLSKKNAERNWSINMIPKSAYLDRVRSNFPEIKNGLKINEYGQMSINDSAFSSNMNMPQMQIHTVKSSNGKLGLLEKNKLHQLQIEEVQNEKQNQKIAKKLDFDEDDNQSVRTTNQLSKQGLPDFEYSRGYDSSIFSADFDTNHSRLTKKNNEQESLNPLQFNLQEELQKLPNHDFFGVDLQVPDIKNQVNDSQFNMSLLEQLDFKDETNEWGIPESNHKIGPLPDLNSNLLQETPSHELTLENEGFELTLKELKTQLDAAHYKMFDSKFDTKFEELTRKLREYWVLDRDVNKVQTLVGEGKPLTLAEQQTLNKIFQKRRISVNLASLTWSEKLGKMGTVMETEKFEESLRKLMRDPSGFNSFLILVKKRLSEHQILFQNSF